jgi:long-chain acyl-CoA synthetase
MWGREVVSGRVDGHPCLLYAQRPGSLPQLLAETRRWGPRPYLVHGERRLTYADHEAAVLATAGWLLRSGVRPGDRIVLLGANRPEWIIACWAVLQLGGIVVPGNAWWSPTEADNALGTVKPTVVLVDDRRRRLVPGACPIVPFDEITKLLRGSTDPLPPAPPPVDENDPAVIVFTSGTTGAPKGVTLSHRAVIASLQNHLVAAGRLPPEMPDDQPGRATLMTVPLFHAGAVNMIVLTALTGGTLVFLDGRFDPGEVLRLIESERIFSWPAVPTMLTRVLEHPDLHRRDTSSLRSLTLGGSPVAPTTLATVAAAFPSVRQGAGIVYGLTESAGGMTVASGDDVATRPGTVGRPMPVVEIRIDQPNEGGVGEILARSPGMMSGYWSLPDDPTLDADGWLHTGDLGRLDDNGWLYVVDRSKDVIIRGGENIASAHVEACLLTHPAVSEVAVVGLPDADLGEVVGAAVVPRPGAAVTVEALRAHAADGLAYFAVPSVWWVRDEPLPTNPGGKVLKALLRESWPAQC